MLSKVIKLITPETAFADRDDNLITFDIDQEQFQVVTLNIN